MRIQRPISVVLAWTLWAVLPAEAAVIIIVGDNDVSVASNSTYTVTESSSPIPALRAYATSTVRISGGQIGTFDAVESNHSFISGGTIQTFTLYHSAVSEIVGGQIGQISTWDTNHISWFGGSVASFTLRDISTLTVYGKDLRLNLAGSSSQGWITGFLQDGTAINTPFF